MYLTHPQVKQMLILYLMLYTDTHMHTHVCTYDVHKPMLIVLVSMLYALHFFSPS